MAWIYLVRHGQASFLSEDYDRLSDTGKFQAMLLGQEFARCGVRFDAVITGSLLRQQQTAGYILEAMGAAETRTQERPGLNEFYPEVWTSIAKELAREDHTLRHHLIALRSQERAPHADRWENYLTLTLAVLTAWVENRFPGLAIESFADFTKRVYASMEGLPDAPDAKILVVSSSTPSALLIGRGLELGAGESLRFMRWLYNTSWSLLHASGSLIETVSFNDHTHLKPAQVTMI